MAIDLTCPECGKPIRVSERIAGKRVRCPSCQREIRIPKVAAPLPESRAKAPPVTRKPPASAKAPGREPGPVISPDAIAAAVVPGKPADAGRAGRVSARPRPKGPPWALVAVAAVLGLALVAVAVSRMGGKGEPEKAKTVAQAGQDRRAAADPDEEIILLDDVGSGSKKRPTKASDAERPKKEQTVVPPAKATPPEPAPPKPDPHAAGPSEVKPGLPEKVDPKEPEPAEAPGEEAKPAPPDTQPTEPPPTEPPPMEPAPTDPPPIETRPEVPPPPTQAEPEVPAPGPSEPAPGPEDQTKVDVIKILPSAKAPAEKPGETKPRPGTRPRPRPKNSKPGDEASPVVAGPPDPNCRTCRGLGKVPLASFKPYVYVEGMPAPNPAQAVPWRFCPKCQQGQDGQSLVDAEAARLKTAGQKHQRWEQKTGWQLVRVENHLMTIHAQLPAAEAQKVGLAVEMMAKHLQELTGSMELTVTRPDNYEMLILWEKQNYAQFLKLMAPEWMPKVGNNWSVLQQVAGSTIGPTSFFRQLQAGEPPPAHTAVSMAAQQQMVRATSGRAPIWLREGFAAYCENTVLGKNLVHAIDYEVSNLQLSPDWAVEMRRLAAFNKLKPWQTMFALELRDYQAAEYITSFSMVAFLIRTQPVKFLNLVRAIGQGKPAQEALTESYGKGVDKLQNDWLKWLAGRR